MCDLGLLTFFRGIDKGGQEVCFLVEGVRVWKCVVKEQVVLQCGEAVVNDVQKIVAEPEDRNIACIGDSVGQVCY